MSLNIINFYRRIDMIDVNASLKTGPLDIAIEFADSSILPINESVKDINLVKKYFNLCKLYADINSSFKELFCIDNDNTGETINYVSFIMFDFKRRGIHEDLGKIHNVKYEFAEKMDDLLIHKIGADKYGDVLHVCISYADYESDVK